MLRRTFPRLGGCQAGFSNSSFPRCGNYSNQRAMSPKVAALSQLKPRTEVFPCACLAWGRDFRRPPCGRRFGLSRVRFGEGNDNPLHYSFLENPMDRGAWQAMVHRVAESQTRLKRLSIHRVAESRTRLKRLSTQKQFQVSKEREAVCKYSSSVPHLPNVPGRVQFQVVAAHACTPLSSFSPFCITLPI